MQPRLQALDFTRPARTVLRWAALLTWAVLPALFTLPSRAAGPVTQAYAAQCNADIGLAVPDFDCNDPNFTEVPVTVNGVGVPGATNGVALCDRPNRLNGACDPGSRFRVWKSAPDFFGVSRAYVVAHCRRKDNPNGTFGDIAVIQHNIITGATCFYQEGPAGGLSAKVSAPTNPTGNQWNEMNGNGATGCMSCHDNGPIIRSPYFAQVLPGGKNTLPGVTSDRTNNHFNSVHTPYYLVGNTSAKAYAVTIAGNECNGCHRMGMTTAGGGGTARDFGLRATHVHNESSKEPDSPTSPVWMPPGLTLPDNVAKQHAQAIADCANQFAAHQALPAGCSVARYDFPYGPDVCASGYVWREAYEFDHVCVLPGTRSQAWQDNAQANARRSPTGGAYGPDTCRQGYVWREANKGNPLALESDGHVDHVCVVPGTRSQAATDNALAMSRRLSPQPQ